MYDERAIDGEKRVAVVGDWHGNRAAARNVMTKLKAFEPTLRTVLHVGDFGIGSGRIGKGFLLWVDGLCRSVGIEQILVTPGNHDNWERLDQRFASRPGEAVKLSDAVWVMPRGHRFKLGAWTALSFGGAVSVDRQLRTEGRDWWPAEAPTDEDVDFAIEGGPVDLMISHDTVDGDTVRLRRRLTTGPSKWPEDAIADAEWSRGLVTQVWEAVRPTVLLHGHFHVREDITLVDGRRVYSLAAEDQRGSAGLLDLGDLSWTWIS